MILAVILFVVFLIVFFTPSGPACPKCKSHATMLFNYTGTHKELKTKHSLSMSGCHKCLHVWGATVDGEAREIKDGRIQERSSEEEDV